MSEKKSLTTLTMSRYFLLLQLRSWLVVILFLGFFFAPLWVVLLLLVAMLVYDVFCRSIFVRLFQSLQHE